MYDNDKIKSAVAANISKLRVDKGLTQLQLAEMLSYSDKAVSKWERAESVPDIYVLKQIADLFGVSIDYLIASEHTSKNIQSFNSNKIHQKVVLISLLSTWALSSLLFVILWILWRPIWQIFVYTFPIAMILLLVFNSIWGKRSYNFYWISGLIVGTITSLYVSLLTFAGINVWQLFILILPAELVLLSVFKRL